MEIKLEKRELSCMSFNVRLWVLGILKCFLPSAHA
jgi:hypothetical protein